MSAIGGDIKEIQVNHPVLGNFTFDPKANEDGTFDPGGVRTNDDASQVTGNGKRIKQMNNVGWSIECTVAWDNNPDTLGILKQLAGHPVDGDWTITRIDGTVWGANGNPVGDIQGSSNAGTITLKVAGGREASRIV